MEIVGFSGKMGTGKDYLAQMLMSMVKKDKKTICLAFADHLKIETIIKDNINFDRVFVKKDLESRQLLQKRGTEDGRNIHGEDVWIKTLENWIKIHYDRGVKRVLITDVRFENEANWIKEKGGILIRVESNIRNKIGKSKHHLSEVSLDHYKNFDYIINNDPGEELNVINIIRDISITLDKKTSITIFCDLDDTVCKCKEHYSNCILQVKNIIKNNCMDFNEEKWNNSLIKNVWSFEDRYFTKTDFSESLINVALDFGYYNNDEIFKIGMSVFNQPYEFINKDYRNLILEYSENYQLVFFTLGDHNEQMRKICYLGLHNVDIPIEIFSHKDSNIFKYLKQKYPSKKYVMIGDSYNRDILPAIEANIEHIFHITNKCKQKENIHNIIEIKRLPSINELKKFIRF